MVELYCSALFSLLFLMFCIPSVNEEAKQSPVKRKCKHCVTCFILQCRLSVDLSPPSGDKSLKQSTYILIEVVNNSFTSFNFEVLVLHFVFPFYVLLP